MSCYARVIIKGSPISKSNFKMFNSKGRAILPNNSGKYHDRYANYEEQISYEARIQNPNIVLDEALIAILKVYYKSEKRHPDTNNITKSIFDGIEKSGLIVNDVQIRRIIIEEFYDKENPRFELELFGESEYSIDYKIVKNSTIKPKTIYSSNKKITSSKNTNKNTITKPIDDTNKTCSICGKTIKSNDFITANKGKTVICRKCLSKTF
ncbi:RusA family crossover junction endodeoxyribonuclease [Sarcina sp. JB2]|uniref:RusA family crossover junction endodeoxyribonuclease n=1 Tax=Candidatus Sarcina troglodytae TaxID=2726954 RepID=A0ACD1BF77_9CLOT|nr:MULTISPECIES: RusA family crossover junction endodeoxyribonuclease [Sarcina]QPJ86059.1 RusA family crossover junction endodeoxyribonuclease [Sarcina sp. JB2]